MPYMLIDEDNRQITSVLKTYAKKEDLAIVREIADRHHIQVNVKSMVGKGTIFQLSIPLYNNALH